jgi:hypothetical protein
MHDVWRISFNGLKPDRKNALVKAGAFFVLLVKAG